MDMRWAVCGERKLASLEKALREKVLNKRQSQYETAKACMEGYESRIKELESTNKILQQVVNATGKHHVEGNRRDNTATAENNGPAPCRPQDSLILSEIARLREDIQSRSDTRYGTSAHPTDNPLSHIRDDLNKLRDEMRIRDLESKVSSEVTDLEYRINLQFLQTNQMLQTVQLQRKDCSHSVLQVQPSQETFSIWASTGPQLVKLNSSTGPVLAA